jgi:hypothetical protein
MITHEEKDEMLSRYEDEIISLATRLVEAKKCAVEYADALHDVVDGNHKYDIHGNTGLPLPRCGEICELSDGALSIIGKYKGKK